MLSDVGLALEELLPAQAEAVTHRGISLLVLGAGGSGKTRVVQARFEWLVEDGCRPEQIAVVVPSTARADALTARLETALVGGYDELLVLTPVRLAALILGEVGAGLDALESLLDPGERFAMLRERVDEISLERHDFGGSAKALLGGFIRKIDRLKGQLIDAEEYAGWAAGLSDSGAERSEAMLEREFAEV
jgi:superfamily I DNA/RNA helicase